MRSSSPSGRQPTRSGRTVDPSRETADRSAGRVQAASGSIWVFRAPLHRDRLVQAAACLAVLHILWVVHTSVTVPSSILRVLLGIPSSLYLVGVTVGTIRAYRRRGVSGWWSGG